MTTDSSGQASFTVDTPSAVAIGQSISATATDPAGDTSEFSHDVTVVGPWTVTGEVFNDLNGNGSLDNGEPGLAGWTVQLVDGSNNVIDTTTTECQRGLYLEWSDRRHVHPVRGGATGLRPDRTGVAGHLRCHGFGRPDHQLT